MQFLPQLAEAAARSYPEAREDAVDGHDEGVAPGVADGPHHVVQDLGLVGRQGRPGNDERAGRVCLLLLALDIVRVRVQRSDRDVVRAGSRVVLGTALAASTTAGSTLGHPAKLAREGIAMSN